MNKKICFVCVEAKRTGAIERYGYELTKILNADLYANNADIKFHKIPSIKITDLIYKNLFPLFAQLLIRRHKYDIIHIEGATYFFPDVITVFGSQFDSLIFLHKDEFFISIPFYRKIYWYMRIIIPYILERIIYKRKNIIIIAISEMLKNRLIHQYNVDADKIFVIYPGVDINEFKPDKSKRERVRKELNLSGLVLIFVGSQWGRKGLKYLIEAVAGEPYTLLVVGGRGLDMKSIKNFPNNIKYLGFRDDISELYNAADIFILPTLLDAFGFTVLEAMASGLPVIISKYCGASEIIDGCGLIIDNPRNPLEIKEKINILKDEKLRENYGKRARLIAENYSWEKISTKIKEIYKEIT